MLHRVRALREQALPLPRRQRPAAVLGVAPAPSSRVPTRRRECLRTRLDRETTRPMVWLSFVFLGLMTLALPHSFIALPEEIVSEMGPAEAAEMEIVVPWAPPPESPQVSARTVVAETLAEPSGLRGVLAGLTPFQRATLVNHLAVAGLVLLAIPFWIEAGLRMAYIERGPKPECGVPRPSKGRVAYLFACALIPPLRTGLHPATLPARMWLPLFGWRRTTRQLSRHVQRAFGVPMLCIGLLILPVLVGELALREQTTRYPGLAIGLDVATRLIWFAFALEFIVMVAVTPRKLEYATRHWVDLVIILLPFVAFLRSLQVLRAGQLLKAQRMSQLARTYRLRGVAVKLLQAVLLLRVLEGISDRAAKRRIEKLREQIDRRHIEIHDLVEELRALRSNLAQRKRKRRSARRERRNPDEVAALASSGEPALAEEGA